MRSSWRHVDYANTDLEHDDREWTPGSLTMKILMHRSSGAFFEYELSFSCSITGYY